MRDFARQRLAKQRCCASKKQSIHSCLGVPPLAPIWQHFVSAIYKVWHFLRVAQKDATGARALPCHKGNAPPLDSPFRACRHGEGRCPSEKRRPCAIAQRLFFLPRRRPPSDLTAYRCQVITPDTSTPILSAGGFILGATRPQTLRQGNYPLDPI